MSFFRLKYLLLIFLTNSESVLFLYFLSHFLSQSKNSMDFLFDFYVQNHPSFAICWSSGKKKTRQCLSTIQIKLYSSFILPKQYQIFITFSASQHKDRSLFQKAICFLVISRQIQIRVCTTSPSNNIDCI